MILIANMNNKDANILAYAQPRGSITILNIPTVQRKCQGLNIQSWMFTPVALSVLCRAG